MNKKGIVAVLASLIIVIILGGGYTVYSSSPSRRMAKQITLGEQYLSELNYEAAVAAFTEALSIDPTNDTVRKKVIDSYKSWSDDVYAKNSYKPAIELLDKARGDLPDIKELEELEADLYLRWADEAYNREDYDEAVSILTEALTKVTDQKLSDRLAAVKEKQRIKKEQIAAEEKKQKEEETKNSIYSLAMSLNNMVGEEQKASSFSEKIAGIAGVVVYGNTLSQRKSVYDEMIAKLQEYITLMEENRIEELTGLDKDFSEDVGIGECKLSGSRSDQKYLTLVAAYYWKGYYCCCVNDMNGCLDARTRLAQLIGNDSILGDHSTGSGNAVEVYDRYGRETDWIGDGMGFNKPELSSMSLLPGNGSDIHCVFEYGNGFEVSRYTEGTMTITADYQDGKVIRIVRTENNSGRSFMGMTFSNSEFTYDYLYAGDTVTKHLTGKNNGSVSQDEDAEVYTVDKYGYMHSR